jgi:3-oxoacyl-[acyl-carrier-protein] synthase-1
MRLALQLGRALHVPATPTALSCACASGVLAIAAGARRIRTGEADRVLVVAADALNQFIVAGFGGLGALDPDPCRPFDAARRGVSLGEGAGAVVLTALPGESIGVRVRGWAGANDGCHTTGPDYEGRGIGLAARRAIAHAGLLPTDIDALHLHGTGTRANDKSEAIGLSGVFASGGHKRTPPAFGSKGQTGHTLGAAGVIESLLAIEMLRRGEVPKNHGLAEPDVHPGLDLVTAPRRLVRTRHALKVASGFGGLQGALVLST